MDMSEFKAMLNTEARESAEVLAKENKALRIENARLSNEAANLRAEVKRLRVEFEKVNGIQNVMRGLLTGEVQIKTGLVDGWYSVLARWG